MVRVDSDKGYIDLSKRRVTPEDIIKCEERYNKAKAVHSIIYKLAQRTHKSMMELNRQITWPLAMQYKSAYEALLIAMKEPDAVLQGLNLDQMTKSILMTDVKSRLSPQAVKIRADIEVSCFTFEGIDAVRAALMAGLKKSTDEIPIKINLVAPPLYVMLTSSLDKQTGIQALENAIAAIDEVMKARGGKCFVKAPPRATSIQEENALAKELERIEKMNAEVDGDDSDSDEENAPNGGSEKGTAADAGKKRKGAESDDDEDLQLAGAGNDDEE